MTTNPEHFRRRDPAMGGEHYFDAAIRTASPARLRLMLIERAVEVSSRLSQTWQAGQAAGANEHSLQLLDLLTELLGGVVGGDTESENEVCRKVSDLYVFLAKHLVAAETSSDSNSIDEIRLVLEAEAETWRAVCAQEMASSAVGSPTSTPATPSSGICFDA